jgi:hypothetical protein
MSYKIDVLFEKYETYCSRCDHAIKDLETAKRCAELATDFRERKNKTIPLKCAKPVPCTVSGKWKTTLTMFHMNGKRQSNLPE